MRPRSRCIKSKRCFVFFNDISDVTLHTAHLPPKTASHSKFNASISLYKERKSQRRHYTDPHDRPSSQDNLPITECRTCIPRQMPKPIEAMEGKWKGKKSFHTQLQEQGPARKRRSDARRLQMPPKQWGDQVRGAEGVEWNRES